jgi:hypothetical protein
MSIGASGDNTFEKGLSWLLDGISAAVAREITGSQASNSLVGESSRVSH